MRLTHWLVATALIARWGAAFADVPLSDFAKHDQYGEVKISPDGRTLSAVTNVNGQRLLTLVDLTTMKSTTLRPREGDDIADTWWVATDRVMYNEGEHVAGQERPIVTGELYSVKADGSGANILFGYRAGSQMPTASHIARKTSEAATGILVSALKDDPTHALIASYGWNGPNHSSDALGAYPEIFRLDLRDGNKTLVATSPLRSATILADHTGAVRFAYGTDNDGSEKVWYREASGGDWQLLHDGSKQHGEFVPLMFDRSNASAYVRCTGDNGVGGICRWNAVTKKSETLWSAKESSAGGLLPTADGMDAFAIRSQPGRPAITLLDKSAPEVAILIDVMKQFPGEDVTLTSASHDGKRMVFLVRADTDPGVYLLYDADTKKLSALFQRRAWIKPAAMATMEPIALKSRDGMALNGYLTRPVGKETAKHLPTVVLVHGGPYGIRDVWGFDPEVQMLASHGHAVLQVNFRGSGGYGNAFERAGYREWGGKMQDDVTDATRWAIEQGIADKNRICIFGTSYGGYAAIEGATKEPDLYTCAIANAGVYDLRLMSSSGDIPQFLRGQNYLKLVLGENQDELYDRSPIAHIDRLKSKVMLIVGGADTRVPAIQGERLHDALTRAHVEHEWLYEKNEGHGFYDEAHTAAMYEKVAAFLEAQIGKNATAASK
ncbi:MAG: S9 family peptidase [Rudaea sp.]